jgi:hypothetical protein
VFGLSYAQVGIIRAVKNSAMALFELPSGVLSERLGERTLLVFGLLCAGFANTFQGAGARTALGTYNSAGDVGKLAFTAFYSLAIGMGIAWQGVVAGFGLTAVLGAAALFFILRRLQVGSRPSSEARANAATGIVGWASRSSYSWILPCRVVSLRSWHF